MFYEKLVAETPGVLRKAIFWNTFCLDKVINEVYRWWVGGGLFEFVICIGEGSGGKGRQPHPTGIGFPEIKHATQTPGVLRKAVFWNTS